MEIPVVTFVTPCKGRLHHLKETYLRNIKAADGLPVRFHLLNIDSPDGLHEWVIENMAAHMESGKVAYFRTVNPCPIYSIPKADNASFLTATTPVISNMMADNICTRRYFEFVCEHSSSLASGRQFIFMSPWFEYPYDIGGRLSFGRETFLRLGGYEEAMVHWGYQDVDICERAILSGVIPLGCSNKDQGAIEHDNKERMIYDTVPFWQKEYHNIQNEMLSRRLIEERGPTANKGRSWGNQKFFLGFTDEVISVGMP